MSKLGTPTLLKAFAPSQNEFCILCAQILNTITAVTQ